MEEQLFQAFVDLSGTGILVYVLYKLLEKVLERQATDQAKVVDVLIGVVKENAAAMQASAVASGRVEKAIDKLPGFMVEVLGRLQRGEAESANHGVRITDLESTR